MTYVRFEQDGTGEGLFAVLDRFEAVRHRVRRRVRMAIGMHSAWLHSNTPVAPAWAYDPPGRPGRARTWWVEGAAAVHIAHAWSAWELLGRAGFCVRVIRGAEPIGEVVWRDQVQAVIVAERAKVRGLGFVDPGAPSKRTRWSGDRTSVRRRLWSMSSKVDCALPHSQEAAPWASAGSSSQDWSVAR